MSTEFYTETKAVENGPGRWNYLDVSVYQRSDLGVTKIGSYRRNYSTMYHTFHPFKQGDDWFALYSKDYTATRVMTLPSCQDIAGEDEHLQGFCPVDYFVPFVHERVVAANQSGRFGLIAGCVWGDDSSWKIQYLDLSKIRLGIMVRKELFGYLAMPSHIKRLQDCVSFSEYFPPDGAIITLTAELGFNLLSGKRTQLGD
jgi:hypothetical protein